jgi:hypothetical protein
MLLELISRSLKVLHNAYPCTAGVTQAAIRPYLLDLGAVNGTFLNGERIEAERYYELLPKVIQTLCSTTFEVLFHSLVLICSLFAFAWFYVHAFSR